MKEIVRKLFGAVVALACLTACNDHQFRVEGTVEGAADEVLYLENVSLSGPVVLDSAKLSSDGSFAFSQPATSAPEFYRLRIADQIINLAVDSTETITIKAQYPNMATRYEVTGSEECTKIRELALRQISLQQHAIELEQRLAPSVFADSLQQLLTAYKNDVKNNYIFKEPYCAYAYFALFQSLGPWLIFNPRNDKDDVKVFAAVATSWDTYFPGAERGQNLHNIALEGMKNVRIAEQANEPQALEASKVQEAGVIDIRLADNQGRIRSLTELKGKVVLLDFHVFAIDTSPQRILMLRELYNKYHAQGFEIYQVSLDPDEHFWKQMTSQLPWVCVRDADGMQSSWARIYNVASVPDFFLIDRQNNLLKRAEQMKDIEAEIKKQL